jgi:hypothetical protein
LAQGLDVDRLVQRPAHAQVLERVASLDAAVQQLVAVLVHADEDDAVLGAVDDLDAGGVRRRAMSRGAGSSTKSISPETSAASRVASLAIGVKTISCTLPSKRPHHCGLRL